MIKGEFQFSNLNSQGHKITVKVEQKMINRSANLKILMRNINTEAIPNNNNNIAILKTTKRK